MNQEIIQIYALAICQVYYKVEIHLVFELGQFSGEITKYIGLVSFYRELGDG